MPELPEVRALRDTAKHSPNNALQNVARFIDGLFECAASNARFLACHSRRRRRLQVEGARRLAERTCVGKRIAEAVVADDESEWHVKDGGTVC